MRAFKVLAATGLTIVAVLAFGVGAASADPDHLADCAFSGLAGTADPFPPHEGHATGVESVLTDISNTDHGGNIILDQDHGRYTFAGDATCVISDDAGQRAAPVTIDSTGVYANTICGTGTASSVEGRTNAEEGSGRQDLTTIKENGITDLVNDVSYSIDFRAGNGVLLGSADHNPEATHDHSGTLLGFVHITPDTGNCATTDVQAFDVAGDFVIDEAE
jgi:hypothetical protein